MNYTQIIKKTFILGTLMVLSACVVTPPANQSPLETEQAKQSVPAPIAITPKTLRAERLDILLNRLVHEGSVPGISLLIYDGQEEGYYGAAGYADISKKTPLERNAVGRFYSMTKPIVGVGLMKLYEQGKFKLSDPISQYLPEFQNMKVYAGQDGNGNIVSIPAQRAITIEDLMRHTAGFTYGFGTTQIDKKYTDTDLLSYNQTNAQFTEKLANLPLLYQPSTQYHYSVAVDVQGRLIEVLSGQTLGDYLNDIIFEPLGMTHTGFTVKASDKKRFGPVYGKDDTGIFAMYDGSNKVPLGLNVDAPFLQKRDFESGGGGLVSSLDDYAKFALMLQRNDGQIIKPETLNLMSQNHLGAIDNGDLGKGMGFGLDFAVKLLPHDQGDYHVPQGSFFWGGMAGTEFMVDRKTGTTYVLYKQIMHPDWPALRKRITKAIYGS